MLLKTVEYKVFLLLLRLEGIIIVEFQNFIFQLFRLEICVFTCKLSSIYSRDIFNNLLRNFCILHVHEEQVSSLSRNIITG